MFAAHDHVVIEVLAANPDLRRTSPTPLSLSGRCSCQWVTTFVIVAVLALAKSRSDIDVEVDVDDCNLRVLVERLCHSKETGVSYGSCNTCHAIKCSLLCGTSDASQYNALQSHRRRSHWIRNVDNHVEKKKASNHISQFLIPQHDRCLGAAEQELHVLRCQLLHGDLVLVDCAVDHVRLLLLQHDHARLDGVFNAQASDDTRPLLTDTMATVSRLPFGCRVPPSVNRVSRETYLREESKLTGRQ